MEGEGRNWSIPVLELMAFVKEALSRVTLGDQALYYYYY